MIADRPADPRRHSYEHDGLMLSYLDSDPHDEDNNPVLLALHGHLNEARFIDRGAVPPDLPHRVIALDQRGHGESDHATRYDPDDYVGDALALLDYLEIERAAVLGHSLGGAIAYLLAAHAPDRVEGFVVVDIGAVIDDDLEVIRSWPRRAPTRKALVDAFGFMGAKQEYVMREYLDGWGVPWNADDMVTSQKALNGDHWDAWLASDMPAMLVHGTVSQQLSAEHAEDMADRRAGTALRHLEGGHAVYLDAAVPYRNEVTAFLRSLLVPLPGR